MHMQLLVASRKLINQTGFFPEHRCVRAKAHDSNPAICKTCSQKRLVRALNTETTVSGRPPFIIMSRRAASVGVVLVI